MSASKYPDGVSAAVIYFRLHLFAYKGFILFTYVYTHVGVQQSAVIATIASQQTNHEPAAVGECVEDGWS